jgi:hypothetical protein
MNERDNSDSSKIEELYMEIIAEFEDAYSGLFVKGVTDPEVIKKGDLNELGKSLQRMSEFMDNRIQDLEYEPQKEELDKTLSRLKMTNKAIFQMGKEIEMMKSSEPMDYHWYLIGALVMNLISLFNHIEIHMDYH